VGTPDDGGRLPPRDLTGEQICTERDFREREGSAGRRTADDGCAGRRTTGSPEDWAALDGGRRVLQRTGQRWNHRTTDGGRRVRRTTGSPEDWAALESPDDGCAGRRTTDGGRRTTDDGFSRSVRREISERERGLRSEI